MASLTDTAGYLQARVKSVLSGDTVILTAVNNPKSERTLSLVFVSAPRLKGDEPFAFQSRDFLRKSLVGRAVAFKIYHKTSTGREYGRLAASPTGPFYPDEVVTNGWAKLRDDADKNASSEEANMLLERLQVSEARAKADSKGVWGESGGRVDTKHELVDVKDFLETNKGKALDGIVEKVITGDRLLVRLLVSPTQHVQTLLLVAGIRAPSTKRVNEDKETPAEPFGEEAQQFLETRLLQREVKIDLLGASPQNQLVGVIRHPTQGSIAPHLLKAGLARCTDFHSTLLGKDMGVLRLAEKEAKDSKRGVYHAHTAKAGASENEAVVSRVLTPDTVFIRNKAGAEKRISFSSIRQPKPSDPKQAPWNAEAKEFLRKKLIGKHVKVQVNGKREANEGYEDRELATVTQGSSNIALLLVGNGYASVVRHRHDDSDRSPIYDELLQAEQKAQEEQKGIWSPKPPKTRTFIDYSESVDKAKRQLSFLSRQKRVPAIVDYVKSASRFTVLIPREDTKLTLVLSGIRAPRSARNPTDKAEPFGQEAHDFANKRVLQRDVEIDVEDIDKVGGFIGTLYINRENFAKLLLEEGYASVHAYSAEKSGHSTELFAAEQKAKDVRKGLWHDYDPSAEEATSGGAQNGHDSTAGSSNGDSQKRQADYRDVVITHIDESGHLKLQQIGTSTDALEKLMGSFRSFHLSNKTPLAGPPKVGEVVAAKFSADGEWYRAKVRRNDREKKSSEIVYIDYGNDEVVPWTNLHPLGGDRFAISALKAQAVDAQLSFTQLPNGPEYFADAREWLARETDGRTLVASVDAVDSQSGVLSVTLFDPDRSQSVEQSLNAELIEEGLGLVARKLKGWERAEAKTLETLKKKEAGARDEHRGMWEYGDPTGLDE